MKRRLLNLVRTSGVAAMVLGAALALAPATSMAAERGGHGGGGHYSGGGGHSFAGRGYEGGNRGGYGGYRGGGGHEGYYRGGYGGGYYGGYYAAPRLGFGFSYGAPYGCNPAGYYDRFGRFIPYAGCYVPPYGY